MVLPAHVFLVYYFLCRLKFGKLWDLTDIHLTIVIKFIHVNQVVIRLKHFQSVATSVHFLPSEAE